MDVKSNEVKNDINLDNVKLGARSVVVELDVREQFTNKQEFIVCEHMLQLVYMEARKLVFGVVIGRSDNGFDRRQTFATMRCKISGYQPTIRKLKHDDTRSEKCECSFKLHGYRKTDDIWKFNLWLHNHALSDNLVGHPIVCRLILDEMELVSDMTLNMMV